MSKPSSSSSLFIFLYFFMLHGKHVEIYRLVRELLRSPVDWGIGREKIIK